MTTFATLMTARQALFERDQAYKEATLELHEAVADFSRLYTAGMIKVLFLGGNAARAVARRMPLPLAVAFAIELKIERVDARSLALAQAAVQHIERWAAGDVPTLAPSGIWPECAREQGGNVLPAFFADGSSITVDRVSAAPDSAADGKPNQLWLRFHAPQHADCIVSYRRDQPA